jgi:hypothetical protein
MAPQAFLDRAAFFGAQTAIAGQTAEELVPLAAMASRAIDAYCGREFSPAPIIETHQWNPHTRRISVNQPPVMTLQSYQLITGPGQEFSFNVSQVLVNNQENYLELATLAGVEEVVFEMLAGVMEPQVKVTYLSYSSVPQKVVVACGFTMAKMANDALAAAMLTPGLTMEKVEGATEIRRAPSGKGAGEVPEDLPQMARLLLADSKRIAIG